MADEREESEYACCKAHSGPVCMGCLFFPCLATANGVHPIQGEQVSPAAIRAFANDDTRERRGNAWYVKGAIEDGKPEDGDGGGLIYA